MGLNLYNYIQGNMSKLAAILKCKIAAITVRSSHCQSIASHWYSGYTSRCNYVYSWFRHREIQLYSRKGCHLEFQTVENYVFGTHNQHN